MMFGSSHPKGVFMNLWQRSWCLLLVLGSLAFAQNPADYGLQEGKPYDGVELNFLICCETAPQFASLTQRTAEFTEMTGITVNWAGGPFGSFQEKLLVEATSGAGNFDLFAWVDSWGAGLEAFAVPLNDWLADNGIDMDAYPPAYREASTMGTGDTFYGLPLRGHPLMLFYREDVFSDLGLEVPQTWQDVMAAGEVIRDQTDLDPIAMYYGVNSGQNLFLWLSHLWGNGGEIFDDEMRPVFNSPEGIEATRAYVELLASEMTAPGAVAWNEQEANQEMVQGRAAMFVGWWWMYSRLTNPESAAPEVVENAAFAPAPGWQGGDTVSYGYIWPVGILNSSRNVEAAQEYLRWLTHPDIEREVVLDKSDPALSTNVAVRLPVLADEEVNAVSGGLQATAAEILAQSRTQPLIPEWLEVQSVLEIAINEIAGGADVERTLNRAAAEVESIMMLAGYY
jgi:multiple sugar transport system substrate-binding protein